ncbi:MAG: hypothetical protein IPN36_00495 [Bacteroidetes bacterium]|nr:hypothetical protein [Bacteroidota bacterium]
MKRLYFLLILIFCHHTISAQWHQTNGPGGGVISSFASVGNNLFVATSFGAIGSYGAGVFLSTNNGSTWTPKSVGLASSGIFTLLADGSNLYAGTDGGLFKTTNNGNSWSQVNNGIPTPYIISMIISGTSIFAGTADSGIYVSKQ